MVRLTFVLPDDLAQQASDAGLLNGAAIERLLRCALQQRNAGRHLAELLAKLDAAGGEPLDPAALADEIAEARREHARQR